MNTLDWMLEGDFYSERDKVQIATRTFDDEVFEWWDELKVQRRFYCERPINTWFDLKAAMRKQFRQNNYDEFLPQDRYQSDCELEKGHLGKEFDKLREGLEKIEAVGKEFDTDYHEAVAMVPGLPEDQKNKAIDCVLEGYMLNDKVIRHAKVAVAQ